MAKYQIKIIQIDAIFAKDAIAKAKSDWSALPAWLKKAYEKGEVLFGYTEISVHTKAYVEQAGMSDTIVCYADGSLDVMDNNDFAAKYELAE